MLFELQSAWGHWESLLTRGHCRFSLIGVDGFWNVLTEFVCQLWLVIKEVQLRRSTRLEEVNDSFDFWIEVGKGDGALEICGSLTRNEFRRVGGTSEAGQCDGPQSKALGTEEASSRNGRGFS